MPSITVTKSEDLGPIENLAPGRYAFEVIEASETLAKSSGNEMIKLNLKIGGKPNRVWDNLVFTEKAFWKVTQFLEAVGENLEDGDSVEVTADSLLGRVGIVDLTVEPGTGAAADREFNRAGRYIAPSQWTADERNAIENADKWAVDAIAAPAPAAPAAPAADEDANMPF